MKKLLLSLSIVMLSFLANAQNPYPIIPIDTVQFVNNGKLTVTNPNDSSDYVNPFFKNATYKDTVRFEGYVLFDPRLYGLSSSRKATYLQADTFSRPWGGVETMLEPSGSGRTLIELNNDNHFYENMKPGTKVRVTGVIRTYRGGSGIPAGSRQGETQVNMIKANPNWDNSVEIIDLSPKTFYATPVRIDSLMTGNSFTGQVMKKAYGEKWEGSYIELQNVTVLTKTQSGSRWFWSVADDNGNAIDIGDASAWFRNETNLSDSVLPAGRFVSPNIGTRISYIRGVITENLVSGQYKWFLNPLLPTDIGPISYTPPTVISKSRYPVVATSNDSVGVLVKIQQGTVRVNKVQLFHTVGYSNTVFDTITLTRNTLPNDTMQFYGYIPKRANNSVVKYFIRPIDINGVFTSSPDTFGSYTSYIVKDAGLTTIQELQFSPYPNNQTIWNNDSLAGVDIRGVVTATSMIQGTTNILTVQNGTGPNSAIIVNRTTGDATGSWKVGDSVSLTNFKVVESFNMTTLNNVAGTKISSNNSLPAFITLPIDTISTITASAARRPELAPYEGMLVKFDSVYVVNLNADAPSNFGEFLVNPDMSKTSGVRIDDISTKLPDNFNNNLVIGQLMKKVQGIFVLTFSNWKLEPRDSNDIDFSGAPDHVKPLINLLGKNPDSLLLNSSYTEPGYIAMDDKDGDLTLSVIRIGAVDSSKTGAYILKYTVSDKAGNSDTAIRTVIVYNPVGMNENALLYALVNVYPNPAKDQLSVSVSNIDLRNLSISILDISGRVIRKENVTGNPVVNYVFNTSDLNNGIYFLNIESEGGSKTVKFIINR